MTKQRCYVIPVGPEHHIESLLEELLRQHHYTFWVNDIAMETVAGITRPTYSAPEPSVSLPKLEFNQYCGECQRNKITVEVFCPEIAAVSHPGSPQQGTRANEGSIPSGAAPFCNCHEHECHGMAEAMNNGHVCRKEWRGFGMKSVT